MKNREVLNKLYEVHSVLCLSEYWTQGTSARTRLGTKVKVHSPCAESFCLYGAIKRVFPNNITFNLFDNSIIARVFFKVEDVIKTATGKFNDSHTHGEVLDAIEQVIIEQEVVVYGEPEKS